MPEPLDKTWGLSTQYEQRVDTQVGRVLVYIGHAPMLPVNARLGRSHVLAQGDKRVRRTGARRKAALSL